MGDNRSLHVEKCVENQQFWLTCGPSGGTLLEIHNQHVEENQYMSKGCLQRAAGGCKAAVFGRGIPFGVACLKRAVGEDGNGPIQPADLLGSHKAAQAVN